MITFSEARVLLAVELGGAGRHPAAISRGGIDPTTPLDPAWYGITGAAADQQRAS